LWDPEFESDEPKENLTLIRREFWRLIKLRLVFFFGIAALVYYWFMVPLPI
jgi:hypothetical protein